MQKMTKKILMGAVLSVGLSSVAFSGDKVAPRSPSYGSVMQGNAAVDFTVADYLSRPNLIGEQQFVSGYGAPGVVNGATSIQAMGMNWFAGMDNTRRPGVANSLVRLGVGVGNTFGAGIIYGLNQTKSEVPVTVVGPPVSTGKTEVSTQNNGDEWGVFGSFGFGTMSVFGEFSRETGPAATVETKTTGVATVETKNTANNVTLGFVKDTEGEKSHALAVTASLVLASAEQGVATDNSTMTLGLNVNHGVPLVYGDDFAVFFGAIFDIAYRSFEDKVVGASPKEGSATLISLAPNVSFQKEIGKGFEASLGASANALTWTNTSQVVLFGTPVANADVSNSTTTSGAGNVSVGLRWKKDNFSVDGQVATALLTNGPNFISGTTSAMLASVGVAVGF